jgi:flagellar motor switch protein FliM
MSEQVLTDEEKSALLEGVASGAVEVHTAAGQKYADVRPFELPAASRIRSQSYPQLQALNQQVAEKLARRIETSLHCEVATVAEPAAVTSFGRFCETFNDPPAVITFAAAPLDGRALVVIDAATVGRLVEGFFGGAGNVPPSSSVVAFTPGEISVCRLFGNAVLTAVREVWKSVIALTPEATPPVIGLDLVDAIEERDAVIATRFEIRFAEGSGSFSLAWPLEMVASLLPVFDGRKRERDPVADTRWQKAIRARLPDAVLSLGATVGHAEKQLGELTGLKPGDVIGIDNPRVAWLEAGNRAVLGGRFGVHAGRNAIEITGWLAPDTTTHEGR